MATTSPSHASIFTSLYPLQHNVLKNGHRLNDYFITMAESLRELKYKTGGFVSTRQHFKPGNMNQGFDVFDDPISVEKDLGYRRASRTVDSAIHWLNELESTDRFFLWIHLFDPHWPYDPPPSYLEIFANRDIRDNRSLRRFLLNEHHIDIRFYNNDAETMMSVIDRYDAEIRYVDTELRRLYSYLERQSLNSHSLWIITSDHGEGLGNHRWLEHGKHIYNEQLHIPLIFYSSSGMFRTGMVDSLVEIVDILPTVLELGGGNLVRQVMKAQGRSIVPILLKDDGAGERIVAPREYAFAQRREFDSRDRPMKMIPERTNYEDGEKYAIQDCEYKYIYRTRGRDEFYCIMIDPYELNNIAGTGNWLEERLKRTIIRRVSQFKRNGVSGAVSVGKDTIEELRTLGYVQ